FNLEGDVLQLRGDVPRPGGTVSTTPAGFASFVIPILLIAVVRFMSRRRVQSPLALGMLVALGTLADRLTVTPGAWVGLGIALTWLLVIGSHRRVMAPRKVILVGVVVVAAALALMPRMNERFEESTVAEAYDERAGLMRIAMEAIKANPVLGLGP